MRDKRGKMPFDLCEDFETRRLLTLGSPFVEVPVTDSLSGNQVCNTSDDAFSSEKLRLLCYRKGHRPGMPQAKIQVSTLTAVWIIP